MTKLNRPIPSWLSFDPTTKSLSGTVPGGAVGNLATRRTIQRQSGCDERDNQDEKARLDFVMIVSISVLCNA